MKGKISTAIGLFFFLLSAVCMAGQIPNLSGQAQGVPTGPEALKRKPDLKITYIGLSKSNPVVGERFDIIVTVKNSSGHSMLLGAVSSGLTSADKYGPHGPGPKGSGKVFQVPGTSSGPTQLIVKIGNEANPRTFQVPALAPGKTATFRRSYTAANHGNLIVSCTVDPANLVDEENERNNSLTKTFRILNLPDFRVINFYIKPASNVRALDKMTIYATIKNFGESGAETFMRFDISGDIPGSSDVVEHPEVPVPFLGPNQQTTVKYVFTPLKPGMYTFGGGVNTPARTSESNTHNNLVPRILQVRVKPGGVDLAVNIITPHKRRHWYQNFNIEVIVTNMGNMASGPFNVHFHRAHDWPAGTAQGTWVDSVKSCPGLAPNRSCHVTFTFKYKIFLGSFNAYAEADPERRVRDVNRANNKKTIRLTVF